MHEGPTKKWMIHVREPGQLLQYPLTSLPSVATEHRCLSLWTVRAQILEQPWHASTTTTLSGALGENLALSGRPLYTNHMPQKSRQQVKESA